ncbi:G-type lectin S-receptor-like serine/threonine-protein kinase LECRK2 [Carex rostrata]
MAFERSMFFFFLLAHLFLTRKVAGQAYTGNITRSGGPTLSPSGPYSYLTSPSGEFAFGFRSLESNTSHFLLAIWFNKTSTPQPITWFAKNLRDRAALALAESKLNLTQTGDLILVGPSSETIWSTRLLNATHLALLEQGNLILYDRTESVVWQSFDSPTDTLVPGQSLSEGSTLKSKLTDSDFSPGRFQLEVNQNGSLALSLVIQPSTTPLDVDYVLADPTPFWETKNNNSGSSLVFDLSGLLSYNGSSPINISQSPAERYYQHATLDPDGVFRVYVYDKNISDQDSWSVVGGFPDSACSYTVDVGSGICGFNAYCTQSPTSNFPPVNCTCPPNYNFFDTNRPYLGCRPDFALQNCSAEEGRNFKIVEMQNTDWWGTGDYVHFITNDEVDCRTSCLSDCFCSVAIYRDNNCWKKKLPLSNGMQGIGEGGIALIKVRVSGGTSPIQPSAPGGSTTKKNRTDLVVAGAVMFGASLLILIVSATIAYVYLLRSKRGHESKQVDLSQMGMNMKIFSHKELHDATIGFAEELGRGAFGIVYKGILKLGDHPVPVAVKKLDRLLKDGDREFTNEVQSIGQIHHKYLVKLFGFCNEGPYKMLVYEYMSNGSLTNVIFGTAKLEWNRRAQIAVGVARGLCYLHEGCSSQIIHCDIKPGNILLDENLVPRISDFGLAKLMGVDQTRATTSNIRGTKGYFAPEWFKNTGITPKMDVYSFGVMLMEIVCCRRNIEHVDEEEIILTYWAYDCFTAGRVDLLVQGDEEAEADIDRVEMFLRVAIWCIQENPTMRPTMHKVVLMLEGEVPVTPPPDPSSHM